MSTPKKPLTLNVFQGKTYSRALRWAEYERTAIAITAITQGFPPIVSAAAHGLPAGWPAYVQSVKGMTQVNRAKPYRTSVVDANSVKLVNIDSSEFDAYTSGGFLVFNTPKNLAGYSARMHIRPDWKSQSLLLGITDVANANGSQIIIDNVDKKITIQLGADDTAALDWAAGQGAVFDLEMVSGANVYCPAWGYVNLKKEATT